MKLSVEFRDEKSPLLRFKVPFKLGPIPVISGIAVGTKQDLDLQFATSFPCGPIVKLAFKPHVPNAISLVFKSGLGSWGSPNDSPFMLAAGICLNPNVHDHYFSLRIEPRIGDFSFRKNIRTVNFWPPQQIEPKETSMPLCPHESGEGNHTMLSQKAENGSLSRSITDGNFNAEFPSTNGNCFDKDQVHISPMQSGGVISESNVSRIEGFEKKTHDNRSRLERVDEATGDTGIFTLDNSPITRMPHEGRHRNMGKNSRKSIIPFSVARAQDAFRGCKIITHSSLPIGSRSRLTIRWGADADSNFVQGWDGSLPSLCLTALPSLSFEKISFEQVASHRERSVSGTVIGESSEHGLLPTPFIEENRELAQVAGLCHMMKKQLHLMHAENQVLRRAMEDMKFHVDSKNSSRSPNGKLKDIGSSTTKLPQATSNIDGSASSWFGGEDGNRDAKAQKGKKLKSKWEEVPSKSLSNVTISDCVSKELEKALLDAQAGSTVGKKV